MRATLPLQGRAIACGQKFGKSDRERDRCSRSDSTSFPIRFRREQLSKVTCDSPALQGRVRKSVCVLIQLSNSYVVIARSGATKQSMSPLAARWIASRSLSSGAHSRDPLARNDETCVNIPAARCVRVLHRHRPRENGGRRECRMRIAPMARLQQGTQAAVTTGTPLHHGIPCAMALRRITRSPRCPGFVATVACGIARKLDPSVGGSGPRAFAVRYRLARPAKVKASIASRATCRDDRDTPSCEARNGLNIHGLHFLEKRNIFDARA